MNNGIKQLKLKVRMLSEGQRDLLYRIVKSRPKSKKSFTLNEALDLCPEYSFGMITYAIEVFREFNLIKVTNKKEKRYKLIPEPEEILEAIDKYNKYSKKMERSTDTHPISEEDYF